VYNRSDDSGEGCLLYLYDLEEVTARGDTITESGIVVVSV